MGRTERKPSLLRGLMLFLLGALVGANAVYYQMTHRPPRVVVVAPPAVPASATPEAQPTPAPTLPPTTPSMHGALPTAPALPATGVAGALSIPVQGIVASQLQDTFTDSRSSGRLHDAIDIMAPSGTPVVAVADGRVEKLFTSKLGGLTLYQFNADGTLAYYYAHLQGYAPGVTEQATLTRGQLLGYVGTTGNANPDAPHLHFAIFVLGPEKQWWKGEAVNPYPRLGGTPR